MGQLDDIQKKLNLEIMDDNERKKLFKEFVDHGGKAIDLDKDKKKVSSGRTKGTVSKSTNYPKMSSGSDNLSKDGSKNQSQNKSVSGPGEQQKQKMTKESIYKTNKNTFFQKFGLNLFSYFNKVSNLNGSFFNRNFIDSTTGDLYESIINLQRVALVILNSKSFEEFEIRHFFFKKYPVFNELLIRIKKTKLKEFIDSIKEKEKTAPAFNVAVNDLEKEIRGLFKEFYIFLFFKKQISEAFREGFRILEKKESMNEISVNTYMGRIRRDVSFIFEKYMIRLFYAFLLTQNLNLKINSPEIPILLDISEKDRVGALIPELEKELQEEEEKLLSEGKVKEEAKTQEQKIQETEEKLSLSEEIRKGIEIMDSIRYDTFGTEKNSPYINYDRKDKVFKLAVILDFFEKEYSFLMTGTKVKYYMEHHEGIRFDPKKDLNEVYVDINTVMDNIREYSKQVEECLQTEENMNIPAMQKHNLIHKATIQKTKISMGLRAKLSNSLARQKSILEKIRSNYNKFLSDPNQPITFSEATANAKNRLENKTNKEALEEFYCFVSAFHYLLTKGSLGGAGNVAR